MIYLGLDEVQKKKAVQEYLDQHTDIDRVFVFHADKEQPDFNFEGIETVYTPWSETEMYRTFYPLLGQPYKGQNIPAITDKSLLIVDEMMETTNRSDLKYNCTHHFLRVSSRHLVFNYFPLTNDINDFMILADLDAPDKYKGQSFSPEIVHDLEVKGLWRLPEIFSSSVEITDKDMEKYEKKKNSLFENIGTKDPDTIPRNLLLTVGDAKKRAIRDDKNYVARNVRYKKSNVFTYDTAPHGEDFYIIDMHYQLKVFERFLRRTGAKELTYMNTDLNVDHVYQGLLHQWYDEVEKFYEQADIHQ